MTVADEPPAPMPRPRRRAGVLAAAGLLAVIVAVVLGVATRWTELKVRWHVRALASSDPDDRRAAFDALDALGDPGRRAIAELVFQEAIARPGDPFFEARQEGFDMAWAGESQLEPSRERLVRYLRLARGLERTDALWTLKNGVLFPDEEIRAALHEIAVSEPNEGAAKFCCRVLVVDHRSRDIIRRLASQSLHRATRVEAISLGLSVRPEPADVPALEALVADASEDVRVAAAAVLAEHHGDAEAVTVLVDALRSSQPPEDAVVFAAAASLGRLGERRAVRALARAHDRLRARTGQSLIPELDEPLRVLTGTAAPAPDGLPETWGRWCDDRGSELGPQLDPDAPPP